MCLFLPLEMKFDTSKIFSLRAQQIQENKYFLAQKLITKQPKMLLCHLFKNNLKSKED